MSMYRQLWLAIILSTLLALGGSLLASVVSARSYLESQLSQKNADNATVLALSLSRDDIDAVTVELAVSALFDSGHYELIRVVDPQGKTLVERAAEAGELNAPAWFVESLPLHAVPGQAQISDGWKQFGTLTLVSHSRFAYGALWRSVLETLAALAVSGLVGGLLGSLILRRLKAPLAAVVHQAQAISERRFTTVDEPKVPELRQLARAMNGTVVRLKAMFDEEAARLEAVRREANCDAATGLANRAHFMARLHEASLGEEAAGGVLFILRLAKLAELNRQLGREATDELIGRLATVLRELANDRAGLGGRLNGADFALLLPAGALPKQTAEGLLKRLSEVADGFRGLARERITFWLSGGEFASGTKPALILTQVDTALAGLEGNDRDELSVTVIGQEDGSPRTAEDWSAHIRRALDQDWIRLASFPVTRFDGALLHYTCPLRLKLFDAGDWLPASRFLPLAERLRLTARLDLGALTHCLDELVAHAEAPAMAINLSAQFFKTAELRDELLHRLRQRAVGQRLWLEVDEAAALAHFEEFSLLCHTVKTTGCRIGIKHFGYRFSEIGRLYELGIDYLKVDAGFVHDIDTHSGNQAFLKGLAAIAKAIGIIVIAEGVTNERELATLEQAGFDAATGPFIQS